MDLTQLDLSFNDLSGSFEMDKLSKLSKLETLDLSDNPFLSLSSASSSVNYSLPSLASLIRLDLSYNRIRVVNADMLVKLNSLQILDLSHSSPLYQSNNNNLTLVLPNLVSLSMSSCNITEFSNFLTTQEKPLLLPPPRVSVLLISQNRLPGEIPPSICNMYNSEEDVILDLSHNNLSGAIPRCMGQAIFSVLDLQMNHLHGNIPDFRVEEDYMLQTLNLNNNDFDGPLPKSLVNCHHLEVLNFGNNKINDAFPDWLGTLPQLQVLVLRSSYFHCQLTHSENGSHFSTLRILDISHNEFSGFLSTTYFKSFQGMMSLADNQMRYMEDYDSYYRDSHGCHNESWRPHFSQLTGLNFLEVLNLSENQLVGLIPQGKQFNTFLNNSYVGNTGLCRFPVSKSCGHSESPARGSYEHEDDSAFRLNWKFLMMGYGCGMVFGFSAGYIMMTIRKPTCLVGVIQGAGNRVLSRFKKYR
ncbi:receptor-like protein 9DC3 [Hibiscus syriacus]|uniref:receptor-like protein 9DC3 n=1 Tax=Hibiscus syriacus TaxID=106335 RepID=UPI0019241487|nr:receptor-like protein 9DC3 [Hibiscus syriacus]